MSHLDSVTRYAFARLGSREEAEDVAMEVFQAAFRHRTDLPKKVDPNLYLIGMTRRKIADHLRSRRRQRGGNTISLNEIAHEPATKSDDEGLLEIVRALDTLPELQRDALILKYLLGFSTVEVAGLIRKSPQAANSLLQRARESLAANAPHLVPGGTGEGEML